MDRDKKIKRIVEEIGLNLDNINRNIHFLRSKKIIKSDDKQKLMDCINDAFIYGGDNIINIAIEKINEDKFPQYIRGVLYNLAHKERSSFNYISKQEYRTISYDDEINENEIKDIM
jgi:hypothetical protein